MSEAKFTKGEWKVSHEGNLTFIRANEFSEAICSVNKQRDEDGAFLDDITGANAKLIAAAPKMLKALQNIQDWIIRKDEFIYRHDCSEKEWEQSLLYEAQKALKKATE